MRRNDHGRFRAASVKVMLSYDYCHFEICKSTDEEVTNEQIDEMRKNCMRLADKAVRQYKIAKNTTGSQMIRKAEWAQLRREVAEIEKRPEDDRTPREMAKVKLLRDRDWQEYIRQRYDYEDEWEEEHDDECK